MKEFFTNIHYSNNLTLMQNIVSWCLLPFVPFYWCAAQFKNLLYKTGYLETHKIEGAKVISIGNLTTGGVGKTPIVAQIANHLSMSHKVAILSRGYGGNLSYEEVSVIKSDGKIHYNAEDAGDEPFWLAQNTNENVSVLTCANRVDSGNYAVKNLGCDILILDDGFQHQKLARDLNIVVFDAYKTIGNGFVLPLGPLREPVSSIERADKIIVTNKNLSKDTAEKIRENIEKNFNKPTILTNFKVDKIYDKLTHFDMPQMDGFGAFCAIGQPMLFYQYLEKYYIKFVKSFDDHHKYTQEDVDFLVEQAKAKRVNGLFTTEKDAVKLAEFDFKDVNVYVVKLKLDLNIEELLSEKA